MRLIIREFAPAYAAYRLLQRASVATRIAAPGFFAKDRSPRRLHVYCVGAPKSGTTSLAALFKPHYRSHHEPLYHDLIHRHWNPRTPERLPQPAYFRARDRLLNLEVEASHLLVNAVPTLVEEFPRAKFILLIRDCLSWVESLVNEEFETRQFRNTMWREFYTAAFQETGAVHPPQEKLLRDHGLGTLEGYFGYWARWNQRILDCVPPERLLILPTHAISRSLEAVAAFCSIDASTLTPENANRRQRPNKRIALDGIEPTHLRAQARKHCGALMDRLFPDVLDTPVR